MELALTPAALEAGRALRLGCKEHEEMLFSRMGVRLSVLTPEDSGPSLTEPSAEGSYRETLS
jgi:hypothetical protein